MPQSSLKQRSPSSPAGLFRSKAETLAWLTPRLKSAKILALHYFTVEEWQRDAAGVQAAVFAACGNGPLIVRSSCLREDQGAGSGAGAFDSVLHVDKAGLKDAVETVIASYNGATGEDQVLVQPMLEHAALTAVAFTRDPASGAEYTIINYDDLSGDTTTVTGAGHKSLKTWIGWRDTPAPDVKLAALTALLTELKTLCNEESLDVECAISIKGEPVLLQVRPLLCAPTTLTSAQTEKALTEIAEKIDTGMRRHPFLHGDKTVYGVMPDWNPAEIIGIRPRPLALSLYRELVTNAIWAYQRDNYGYTNLRSFPLMVHFYGLPYIDVRVSFNSFVPADIDGALADRLVNYYVKRLSEAPSLHDKVEFEIVFSCYTLDLAERMEHLKSHGFSDADLAALTESLRQLTNRIVRRETGLWVKDSVKIQMLEARRQEILSADMDRASRIYWLLEDCKRYGTLPFAGLARAGFIAVQILRSLVAVGVLSEDDRHRFMNSLNSVSTQMTRDFHQLDRATFLHKYGHLRPGTYDILSPRYDETPDAYFDWESRNRDLQIKGENFSLSLPQMRRISELLAEHGLEHDVVGLFEFLQAGIEQREYAKFIFTQNLSDAISLFREWGAELGFSPEDLAYADVSCVHEAYAGGIDARALLADAIARGKARYAYTAQLSLPPLITSPDDVRAFHLLACEPNFITHKRVTAPVTTPDDKELTGKIVFIPSADPGYDWLFSQNIAGFVTAYGGVNSHMAIRAGELGLPAVIGAGQQLFDRWRKSHVLHIDCAAKRVEALQ